MRFDFARARFVDTETGRDQLAVVGADSVLTWDELADASDQWMREALERGATRDVPLVIVGHKQAAFIIAITGCLRLGIPFVPVDIIYPTERIQRICEISRSLLLFRADDSGFTKLIEVNQPLAEKQLAYIIFTSGSTGEPKGVQIGMEGVIELAEWMQTSFALGDKPVFMNQAPFSFDLSVYEIVGFLHLGGTCLLNSREIVTDVEAFYARLRKYAVTVWVSTPSFAYQQLLTANFSHTKLPSLKTFLFCGEVLPGTLAKRIRQRFPDSAIINTYGPTEATVATTWMFIDDDVLRRHDPLPVGLEKPGTSVFCDPDSGELCILGNNVMRGYLNRPDLNATKLFHQEGKRGFRTGDTGHIDGHSLVFCDGRMDDQIKLNGYRIELAEVDAAMRKLPGVLNASTIAIRRADGTAIRLVAFIVMTTGTNAVLAGDESALKDALTQHLPKYMIPSEIIARESLPMSPNEKVDRKRLADIYTTLARQV
jgi:D-alanine--poly(phosphoribitol) ligase subunit 1